MQFALVNGEKKTPEPKLTGTCPACGSPVLARCGNIRVHHWAHSSERTCDPWWERETQWHRDWKNKFAAEVQEVVLHDPETGERHIADVRTDNGLVIEFQHSHLRSEERKSREQFYRNMVWVVNGSRLKGDLPRFLEGRNSFRPVFRGISVTAIPKAIFPRMWLECDVPVFFDFQDGPDVTTRNGSLFCLLPGRALREAVVVAMNRQDFVHLAAQRTEPLPIPARQLVKKVAEALIEAERARLAAEIARLSNARRDYRRKVAFALAHQSARKKPARRRRF